MAAYRRAASGRERRLRSRPVSESAELLHLGENLVRIGQLALAIALNKGDRATLVDDEGGAHVGVPVRPVDAVVLAYRSLHVRKKRVIRDADRFGPVLMAEGAVGADTQDLGIRRLEVFHTLIEGGHALGSARSPV